MTPATLGDEATILTICPDFCHVCLRGSRRQLVERRSGWDGMAKADLCWKFMA